VTVSIQFRVVLERAYDAYYSLTDVHLQIQTHVFDVIRSTLPKMDLDGVFLTKSDVSDQVFTYLQRVMKHYGYEIVSTLMTKIHPNPKVRESMNEVNASRREKEAMLHKAESGA
jgi:regulator of protease activity HflC (stomatin/prohibitin superfamily)